MGFAYGTERPLVAQDMTTFALPVPFGGAPPVSVPLSQKFDKTALITTFVISNPIGGSSVYLGNSGVTLPAGTNAGLEIQAGSAPVFRTFQEGRQLYEMQVLLAGIAQGLECQMPQMEKIPFICWDLTRLFITSANAAGSTVTVAVFPQMYL
jgi:hypothetical protein